MRIDSCSIGERTLQMELWQMLQSARQDCTHLQPFRSYSSSLECCSLEQLS